VGRWGVGVNMGRKSKVVEYVSIFRGRGAGCFLTGLDTDLRAFQCGGRLF
jgi:hypothetical protein